MADFIQAVAEREKYAPVPPPFIVRFDRDVDHPRPIVWLPRSTTWSYEDYDGGVGPHRRSIDVDPRPDPPGVERSVGPHAIWLLSDLVNRNDPAVRTWIISYLLKLVSTDLGVFYLDKIDQDGATYPAVIQESIRTVIDQTGQAGRVANELGLYLPRSTRQSLDFFFSSLYWLRKFRPERPALERILVEISHTDLYLVPPNVYEHHPARKLLSYYDDQELYLKFGRIGNRLFPKEYSSKKKQLDGLVAFGLDHFGYIEVERWERPIRLKHHPSGAEFGLDEFLSMKEVPRLLILRLAIQVHASLPWLRDPEAWQPLLSLVDRNSHLFYNDYLVSKQQDELYRPSEERRSSLEERRSSLEERGYPLEERRSSLEERRSSPEERRYPLEERRSSLEEKVTMTLPEVEEPGPTECLVCGVVRSDSDFSLCGHPICLICQAMIKSARCPFCTEHFTAEGIRDDFIRLIQDGPVANRDLRDRVLEIFEAAQERLFQFDWANLKVRLFGLKSL